jgi:hypothetical protein
VIAVPSTKQHIPHDQQFDADLSYNKILVVTTITRFDKRETYSPSLKTTSVQLN